MTERLRALIVDDEPLAREGVRLHLEQEPDFEIVGECGDGDEAVRAIRAHRPDVVFLDIQMPGRDGFGVLDALDVNELPQVVFVTAYDQFALQAFEAHALDYLLKPFDEDRFRRTVDRVRIQLRTQKRHELDTRIAELLADIRHRPKYYERLVVRSGGRIIVLRVEDIDWVEAAANYVKLHVGPRTYLLRETMGHLEEKLDPARFLRIHRSTMVRVDRIKELEPLFQGDYLVILHDGSRLTSSRSYRDRLQQLLKVG